MHTDLMCPSGLKPALNICISAEAFKYSIMCDCMTAVFAVDAHFLSVRIHASDRRIHRSLVLFDIVVDNSVIGSCNAVHSKLLCHCPMGLVILADDKYPRLYPYQFCEQCRALTLH